jgi:hypothetical protein
MGELPIRDGNVSGEEFPFVVKADLDDRELQILHKDKDSGDRIYVTTQLPDGFSMEVTRHQAATEASHAKG